MAHNNDSILQYNRLLAIHLHKVGIVAANLSLKNGEIHHYRLSVSVIPSNVDVWGWKKHYLPKSAKIENLRTLKEGPHLTVNPKSLEDNTIKPFIGNERSR